MRKREVNILKQALRAWFSRIESYFIKEGFERSSSEQTLFIKKKRGKILIVSIYVDDLLFIGDDEELLKEFKCSMKNELDMTDLDQIFICQRKYATEVLKRFGIENYNAICNPIIPGQKIGKDENGIEVDATLYKQIMGSLMYLTTTRPDLIFVKNLISHFMASPTQCRFAVAKRVLRYLKGTMNYGVFYRKGGVSDLVGFSDSDYAGDMKDSKITLGAYVFIMSGGAIAWSSRKQSIVTLLTIDAEFVAVVACACQAIWMRRILKEIGYSQTEGTKLMFDNASTIKLSNNLVLYGRSKHTRVRFHFLRDLTKKELLICCFVVLKINLLIYR